MRLAAHVAEQRRDGVGGLALQEELRVVVLHRRLHGARAVDHHDAEADERDDDRGEHRIDRARRARDVGLGVERRGELHADGAADVLEDHAARLLLEGAARRGRTRRRGACSRGTCRSSSRRARAGRRRRAARGRRATRTASSMSAGVAHGDAVADRAARWRRRPRRAGRPRAPCARARRRAGRSCRPCRGRPAMSTARGSRRPSSAVTAAPTLVPFESS